MHLNIILICGDRFDFLKVETHAEFIRIGHLSQQTVVIALAAAQTVAGGIEADTWNDDQIDLIIGRKGFADRFQDMKATFAQVLQTAIMPHFQVFAVDHHGQQYLLAHRYKPVDQLVGVDLIG